MKFKSALGLIVSGSMAGVTGSHNRFGQYFRQRAIPVNPSSDRQQSVRSVFAALAVLWSSTLTQAQRDAWNLYGDTVEMLDKQGSTIHLTGYNHYLRSNCAILQTTLTRVDVGPTVMSLPEVDPTAVATASEATQLISLVFDTNLPWVSEDGAGLAVGMSSPKGEGVDFIGGPFRYANYIAGNNAVPPASPQNVAVPFAVAEDQKTQVQLRIMRADGRLSTPFRDTFQVGA